MKRFLFLFAILCATTIVSSQNLVLNPSFENYLACPSSFGDFQQTLSWYNPSTATPDLFNVCAATWFVGVPTNFMGNQTAHSGNGYAGFATFEANVISGCNYTTTTNYREYIEGQLSSPLVAGEYYCVSFWVSLGDNATFGAHNMGLYFSDTLVGPNYNFSSPLPFTPQLNNTTVNAPMLDSNLIWQKLEWTYQATGGEQFFVIGNFDEDSQTMDFPNNCNSSFPVDRAYYFIDDVTIEGGICSNCDLVISSTLLQNPSCNGLSDGAINISVVNGISPLTYNWSNGATTQAISGLSAGTYSVLVMDGQTCIGLDTFILTQPAAINILLDSTNDSNCGAADGAIFVTTTAGVGTFDYLWSNGATSQDIAGLIANTYQLTVTDLDGCTATLDVAINNNTNFNLSHTTSPVLCYGDNTGAIDLVVTGGFPPYNYNWSNAATTEDISGLFAGNYTVSISDSSACFMELSLVISQPNMALAITLDSNTAPSCVGYTDGQLNISVSGGSPSYAYLWSSAATTANISGLAAGNYSLSITDANNCTASFAANVPDAIPFVLLLDPIIDSLDCDLVPIGILAAMTSGGSPPYSFLWSNSDTNSTATGLAGGIYNLTTTDANSCTSTASGFVYAPLIPSINPYINTIGLQNTTVQEGDSVFLASANNQTASGLTYSWTASEFNGNDFGILNPNNEQTWAIPLNNGVYQITLTATSADACVALEVVEVTVQGAFEGMPNAFSPNGDALNDKLKPLGLNSSDILEFKIFNRWGQLIYDNADILEGGWDGTYQNVAQPAEVYLFLLRYQLSGQSPKVLKGECTLIR